MNYNVYKLKDVEDKPNRGTAALSCLTVIPKRKYFKFSFCLKIDKGNIMLYLLILSLR